MVNVKTEFLLLKMKFNLAYYVRDETFSDELSRLSSKGWICQGDLLVNQIDTQQGEAIVVTQLLKREVLGEQ